MRVPLSVLLRWCDPGLDPEEIASVLALTGTEVERVRRLGPESGEGFVVGRVIEATQHPDADRLRVCRVDVGEREPAGIVCGAPNVAAGQLVAVALPGAVMPGGMKIKKAKLRGVESAGMICSEAELDLGTGSDGILVLPDSIAEPGTPLAEAVPLGEVVLDLEITPNRPDCLGVYGVARELHAATGAPLADPPWASDLGTAGPVEGAVVEVELPELCPRFTARVYEGLGPVETPIAIRSHLHAAGMRSISPIVDITNYVMLVVGEPMHAFDLDLVEGGALTIREAGADEIVTTLDGQSRTMLAGEVLICDAEGPTSIAGVMGGARSEVSESTSRVLLEAAVWDGPTIHDTSLRLALRSEASGRFEKGLAPVVTERAQAYASVLFEEVLGVRPQPGTIDISSAAASTPKITVGDGFVTGLLGHEIPPERLIGILERLGFEVEAGADAIEVVPPPDRLDVQRAVDVVEEVARIDGLDRIPSTLPAAASAGGLTAGQSARRRLADSMVAEGFFEIAGWSFASPGLPDGLRLTADDPARNAVVIENPMSEEESRLRTTLLGSLLDSAARNAVRGAESIRLFELGHVYLPAGDDPADQRIRLGGVIHGTSRPASWREPSPPRADVFAGSAVVRSVLSGLKVEAALSRPESARPFLHPGRSAEVSIDGAAVGWVGELHPLVADHWALPGAVVFEIDVAPVLAAMPAVIAYRPLSAHPAVRQDLAVTVGVAQSAAELKAAAFEVGGPELESVEVFDVYSGEQVGEGRVSIGLRLSFRAADRTLTEEEASAARETITAALTERFGGEVRG